MEICITVDNTIPDNVLQTIKKNDPKINSFILQFGLHAFNKLEQIQVKHSTENIIKNIELKHNQDIDNIKLQYDNIINKLNNDLSYQTQQNTTDNELFNKKLQSLQINKDTEFNILQNEFDLKLKNKDIEISALQEKFDIKIKSFEDKYNNTITELHDNIKQLNETIHFKNNNIELLNKEIELKKAEKINEINCYYEQGRILAKKDFDSFYSQTLEEKNKLNDKILSYENQIQQLYKQINDINLQSQHNLLSNNNNNFIDVKNDLAFVIEKLTGNASKGAVGETSIENYINLHFSNFSLKDTSNMTAKGDFFMTNGVLKLLIESKNIQNTKANDVNKFNRDIEENIKNGSINAGLYISLNDTNLIDDKKGFVFKIINKTPIIYIGNVWNNLDNIKFAINTLLHLVENGITNNDNIDNDNFTMDLISLVDNIHTHIDTNNKIIQSYKKSIENIVENIKLQTMSLDNLCNTHFQPFTLKYPKYSNKTSKNNDLLNMFNKLRDNNIAQSKVTTPVLQNLGFTLQTIRQTGRIEDIKKKYKDFLDKENELNYTETVTETVNETFTETVTEISKKDNILDILAKKNTLKHEIKEEQKQLFDLKNSIYPPRNL